MPIAAQNPEEARGSSARRWPRASPPGSPGLPALAAALETSLAALAPAELPALGRHPRRHGAVHLAVRRPGRSTLQALPLRGRGLAADQRRHLVEHGQVVGRGEAAGLRAEGLEAALEGRAELLHEIRRGLVGPELDPALQQRDRRPPTLAALAELAAALAGALLDGHGALPAEQQQRQRVHRRDEFHLVGALHLRELLEEDPLVGVLRRVGGAAVRPRLHLALLRLVEVGRAAPARDVGEDACAEHRDQHWEIAAVPVREGLGLVLLQLGEDPVLLVPDLPHRSLGELPLVAVGLLVIGVRVAVDRVQQAGVVGVVRLGEVLLELLHLLPGHACGAEGVAREAAAGADHRECVVEAAQEDGPEHRLRQAGRQR
mmetsp:Transcript_12122/g.37441  ORF Transcript_12122/g.37441 Transcript_12122/m.37441 type:complete len:374 (-) Transcript_12122:1711-2832(-)